MGLARVAAFLATAILASSAIAADMPAMMAPVVVPYNWTGWYMGAHAGGRWVEDFDPSIVAFGTPLLIARQGGTDDTSFVAGGQAGYNRQFAPNWVAGIEGDLSWGRNRVRAVDPNGIVSIVNVLNTPGAGFNTLTTSTLTSVVDARLGWNGSVRGRIGYAQDRWWFFVTGGVAFADAELLGIQQLAQRVQVFRTAGPDLISDVTAVGAALTGKNGEILVGPTVGGGIEWAFADNWSLRGEYLYANYGRQTVVLPNGTFFRGADFETHTARIALNYKFPYK